MGPTAFDLLDLVRAQRRRATTRCSASASRALHTEATLLDLIRLRTVTARIKGEQPGAEASIRKILADEHGQRIMGLAKDLAGAARDARHRGRWAPTTGWHYGFLFAPALTVGGGTGEVQRNIVAERVLGLPHDPVGGN